MQEMEFTDVQQTVTPHNKDTVLLRGSSLIFTEPISACLETKFQCIFMPTFIILASVLFILRALGQFHCQSNKLQRYTSNMLLRILRRTPHISSSSSSRWTGTSGFLHRRCHPKTDCNDKCSLFQCSMLNSGFKRSSFEAKKRVIHRHLKIPPHLTKMQSKM